jgi:DNA-binding NarL/FixJ family response regulator
MAGAIVLQSSSLLDMLVLAFEDHWRRATSLPLADIAGEQAEEVEVTQLDRTMLSLLAAGHKDEAVARQLRITVRTVRRHLHDLADRHGCQSRFQLALEASRRGWIDNSV